METRAPPPKRKESLRKRPAKLQHPISKQLIIGFEAFVAWIKAYVLNPKFELLVIGFATSLFSISRV